ncbi:preprotein translocase subunit YajC [Bartonella sp. LJL80]
MFITNAYAQAAGASGEMSSLMTFAPFVLIFVIMYFLIIRPQRGQMKKRQEMLNAVRRGDTVVTGGGIVGKVTKVNDENGEVEVEIAENTRIRVLRSTLADVRVKGEPVAETKPKAVAKSKPAKKAAPKADNKDETPEA